MKDTYPCAGTGYRGQDNATQWRDQQQQRMGVPYEVYVCIDNHWHVRPVDPKIDTRECGWLGCGDPDCEPVCVGKQRNSWDDSTKENKG